MKANEAARREPSRLARDDRGVSPVIGTILVLFIVLLAMAGILVWGVPAIQGLQEHAEFRSMLSQALQLNAEFLTLRDTASNRVASFSMNEGTFKAETGTRWAVFATTGDGESATTNYAQMYLKGWESLTATQVEVWDPPVANLYMELDSVSGSTFTKADNKTCASSGVGSSCALLTGGSLPRGATWRLQVKNGGTLVGEAWLFDAGRVSYKMSESNPYNRIVMEMGSVFSMQGTAVFVEQKPALKEPDFNLSPKDSSFVFRAFAMSGNSAVTGKGKHTVIANLVGNFGLKDSRPYVAAAKAVRIQVDDGGAPATKGLTEEGFCNYLDSITTSSGADYWTPKSPCGGGDADVLYNPTDAAGTNNGLFSFELTQANVDVSIRQF